MSLQPGTRLPSSLPDSADSDDGWTSIDAVFDYEQQAVVLEVIAAPIEPTVIFQGDTISDALNWAVNVQNVHLACQIFCAICQLDDARIARLEEQFGSTLGLSEEALAQFCFYDVARFKILPFVCEIIAHRMEDLLDSGGCECEICDDTYVVIMVDGDVRDPYDLFNGLITETPLGLQLALDPRVIIQRRAHIAEDEEEGGHGEPVLSTGKCEGCLRNAKEKLVWIMQVLGLHLPSILRDDARSLLDFHDRIFGIDYREAPFIAFLPGSVASSHSD